MADEHSHRADPRRLVRAHGHTGVRRAGERERERQDNASPSRLNGRVKRKTRWSSFGPKVRMASKGVARDGRAPPPQATAGRYRVGRLSGRRTAKDSVSVSFKIENPCIRLTRPFTCSGEQIELVLDHDLLRCSVTFEPQAPDDDGGNTLGLAPREVGGELRSRPRSRPGSPATRSRSGRSCRAGR